MTILGFIIAGVSWFLLLRYAPKYTAQAFLKVLPPVEKDPMIIGGPMVQKDIQYGHRASMAALITRQSSLQDLIDSDRVRGTEWFKRFAQFNERGEITNINQCIRKAFDDLKKHLRAYPHRDQEFVVVSMTCGDNEEAAKIVDEMVRLFLASRKGAETGDIAARLRNLDSERAKVQRDLDAAELALKEVRDRWGFSELQDNRERYFQPTITVKLNDLELQLSEILLEIAQVEAAIETLDKLATGDVTVQVERQVETDPVMVTLAQTLAFQEAQLAGRLAKLGENHRVVQQTRELITEIQEERRLRQAKIAEQTRQGQLRNAQDEWVILSKRLEELKKLHEETTARQKDYDLAQVQYVQRLTIRDERRDRLDDIKEQIQKLNILHDDPETPKVLSMGLAPPPLEVSSPRWEFYFPGGTVLGLMVGAALAFLIELLNDLVRTPRDVGRYLHIPLLAVIPDVAEDPEVGDIDMCHVVRQAPYSIISESYRRFRTNLKLASSTESLKVFLVSSGMAGDGKTSVAVNLAMTLIAEHKKVLLIDANFRRPSLQTIFPNTGTAGAGAERSEFGLGSLLVGLCSYEDAKRSNVVEGLDTIHSGPLPSNPTELLGSYRMDQLIKDRRQEYDYVIIDTSPVLLVSDTKVLARIVDGTILVFNAGATRRGAAQRTIQELREVNTRIVGCVLFAVRTLKGGYFREQFESYRRYQEVQPTTST
jgi:capsular exopolysaccharide synthesis family protein